MSKSFTDFVKEVEVSASSNERAFLDAYRQHYAKQTVALKARSWEKGSHGKGLCSPDGIIYFWVTDNTGLPDEIDYAALGWDAIDCALAYKFDISPDGVLRFFPSTSGRKADKETVEFVSTAHKDFK